MKRFTLQIQKEGTLVLVKNEPLKNHLQQPFNALPVSIATKLCDDLNDIASTGANQLTESFIYCVLSTFLQDANKPYKTILTLDTFLQWDQAYRLAPDPPHRVAQYQSVLELVNFLDGDWQDLPLNYCTTPEQMLEEDVPLVSTTVIDKIKLLYNNFNEKEQFAVVLLFGFYQHISISLPILWVADKITSAALQSHAIPFQKDKIRVNLTGKEKTAFKFYVNRLDNLRSFLLDEALCEI